MARPADKITDQPMVRKPILMPADMVSVLNKIATKASKQEKRNVSFGEIVRRAVAEYDPENKDDNIDEAIIESLISTTQETIGIVRKLNKKLDKSDKERKRGCN